PVAVVTYVLTAVNCVLAVAYLGVALWIGFGDVVYRSDWMSIQIHANRIHSVPLILVFIGSLASLAASLFTFIKVKTEYPTLKNVRLRYRGGPPLPPAHKRPSRDSKSDASY